MGSVSRCCRGAWRLAQGLYGLVLLPQLQILVLSPGSYVAPSRVECGPWVPANPSGSSRGPALSQLPFDLGNPLSSFTAGEGLLSSANLQSCAVIHREFKYEQAWELIS